MNASGGANAGPTVPAPIPPDDPDAWYAPDVRAQDEIHPGVVVTIRDDDQGFEYDVREPGLTGEDEAAFETILSYFESARVERPRTREGAVERMETGLDPKHRTVIDRLVDCSPDVDYLDRFVIEPLERHTVYSSINSDPDMRPAEQS